MNVSRQIGWSQESNLLYQILKQLNKLTSIMFGLKPKYKVYTALLTQSGGDNQLILENEPLVIGVTYSIDDPTEGDFTNVGAPNNNQGTYFVATGTTPNNWGVATLIYNAGAPVVTVLENTTGNIWFTYFSEGLYYINSDNLFTGIIPTITLPFGLIDTTQVRYLTVDKVDDSSLRLSAFNSSFGLENDIITANTSVEIKMYN